jgi:GAF domain-containing protein
LILLTAANFVIIATAPLILPVISFQRAGADSWNILGLGIVLVLTVVFRNALERYRLNEVRETNKQLEVAVQEFSTDREMLEVRVTERTFDLERRNRQIEAATEVSRVAASNLDTDALIRQVVELIQNSFDLYYVGIFLVDERNEWAVLRAGTGEAGRLMLARGHRIRIGEGMVGWCIANARARVALETQEDTVRRSSTELPDTRSEAAIPLTSHNRVLGALTVQSEKPGVFDQEMLGLLQAMSDQVAIALDNARLYTEGQDAERALRRSYGESSRQGWVDTLRSQPVIGYISDPKGVYSVQPDEEPIQNPAKGEILKIPVKVRDQVLGSIQAQKEETGQEWTQDEIEMLKTLVDQLSIALENARLYEDTQRRAERERVAADISARIRESLDVDTVLRTAVMEMRRALNLDEITIRLGESNGQ